MFDNDSKLILERYRLISEIPASLEFASEPESLSKQIPGERINKPKKATSRDSQNTEWQLYQNPKHHPRLKKIAEFTSKGLDKKLLGLGEQPIHWRLINMDIQSSDGRGRPTGYVHNKYSLRAEIKENPDLFKEYKKPNSITIIMTPSGLQSKKDIASLSSWMLAHKCGHAVLSFDVDNYDIDTEIDVLLKNYYDHFISFLEYFSDDYFKDVLESEVPDIYKPFYDSKYQEISKYKVREFFSNKDNFYNSIFTFGSARNKTLREQDVNEELFAQLMQTGKVRINNLIPNEVYSRMMSNVSSYHYGDKEAISKYETDLYKEARISTVIEDLFIKAIQRCRGEILFDIVST